MEYIDNREWVDDDAWSIHYPETFTRWIANIVRTTDFNWTILDILETERRYPHMIDDVFTQLGYRAALKRESE